MTEVDANKVIQTLASKIGALEAENAVLQAQLEAKEDGEQANG